MAAATALAIGGGIAAIGGLYAQSQATNNAANAAQNAAQAQQATASQMRSDVLAQGQQGMNLAQATPQELAGLSQNYQAASQQLQQQQSLFDAIDPAIMGASQQALSILNGGNAGLTTAMNTQRAQQRSQLVNSLTAQYGPGAETSSVGQQALQQFDSQTAVLSQQTNQSALSQLYGMGQGGAQAGAGVQQAMGGLSSATQGYSAIQNRQLNASNAMMGALSGTSQQMIQSAGAPWAGQAVQAQGQMGMGNTLGQLGGMGLGYGALGSMGAFGSAGRPASPMTQYSAQNTIDQSQGLQGLQAP